MSKENDNAFLFAIVVIFALAIAVIAVFCGGEMMRNYGKVILSGVVVFVILILLYVLFCVIPNWNKPKVGGRIVYANTLLVPIGTEEYERNSENAEIEKIVFTDKKTKLKEGCFWGYSKLKTVDLPSGLKEIPDYAFVGCKSLEFVSMSGAVKKVGKFAFFGCSNVKSIDIQKMEVLEEHSFDGCENLFSEKLELSNKIVKINEAVFKSCKKIKSFICHNKIKEIGKNCFENCVELESIVVQSELKKIDDYAFKNCEKLKTIKFDNSVKYISKTAFENCKNIENVEFGISLKKFNLEIIKDVFSKDCKFSFSESDIKNKTYIELEKLKQQGDPQ